MITESSEKTTISFGSLHRSLLILNICISIFYFSWWFLPGNMGNPVLYGLLFFGEIYHIVMLFLFWFTVRKLDRSDPPPLPTLNKEPSVDIFVTVTGEPIEIVEKTIAAAQALHYHHKSIYILNDSYVAHKANWQDYETLAQTLGCTCITRTIPGGAKAGNINHALRLTAGEFFVIFDADMAPQSDFLKKTIPYFEDPRLGFVQTPQFYHNSADNEITAAAWAQQEFFFGPIMRGKNTSNAAFVCGTNVVIRRKTIETVGGINETSIAEDFLTSLFIHANGWKSLYIPEVLAQGLAPKDLQSYYKQQFRWARGSVEILFWHNPVFMRGLSWPQKLEYLSSALFYCNGVIVAIDMVIPLFILFFGISPINASTTIFALYFIPFMLMIVYSLQIISAGQMTLSAISFTQSSWYLQLSAILASITGQKSSFSVTPKQAQQGNFINLAIPHLAFLAVAFVGILTALFRQGFVPSVVSNMAWVAFTAVLFYPYIAAAVNWRAIWQHVLAIVSKESMQTT